MKALTIRFEDSVDISQLPKGTPVTVSDGTIILNGTVMILTDIEESEPALVPHNHPRATVEIGPAEPTP